MLKKWLPWIHALALGLATAAADGVRTFMDAGGLEAVRQDAPDLAVAGVLVAAVARLLGALLKKLPVR